MDKEQLNDCPVPTVLVYHGKVLTSCGNVPKVIPPEGHLLWENFNSSAERHYFRRGNSGGIIPIISEGRETLLFFDTFSPDIAPDTQLFFGESISGYIDDDQAPYLVYEKLCRGGLSPAVSEELFIEKYIRVLMVASFFDVGISHTSMRRINLREILKKASELFSAHRGVPKEAIEIHISPQITENAETLSSPLAFCAAIILSLSILYTEESSAKTSLCVSKHGESFDVSVSSSPLSCESVAHNDSRAVLADIFPEKSNETALLFRMADAARLSVSYGTERDRFYISVSFKAHTLPPSFKVLKFTENEEEILSSLADFLI